MREFELQNLKSLRSVPLICVKITSSSGKESSLTVCLKETVKSLKDKALGGECSKESPFYKLILAKSNRELTDEKTLEEENVQENGKCHGWLWCLGITSFLTFFFFFPRRIDLVQETSRHNCRYSRKGKLSYVMLQVISFGSKWGLFLLFIPHYAISAKCRDNITGNWFKSTSHVDYINWSV